MSKRKIKAFKEGMVKGAKPFSKVYSEISKDLEKIHEGNDDVQQGLRKQHLFNDALIDEISKNDKLNEHMLNDLEKIKGKSVDYDKQYKEYEKTVKNVMFKCPVCGNSIGYYQKICTNCNSVINLNNEQMNIYTDEDEKYKELAHKMKLNKNKPIIIYDEIEDEINKMYYISELCRILSKNNLSNNKMFLSIKKKADTFLKNYKNKHIEIAVLGTVKAGKSSLINGLFNSNLASVDATPETSVLVKYHATKELNYVKVDFYKEKEWCLLWNSVENDKSQVFKKQFNQSGASDILEQYINKKSILIECDKESLSENILNWTKSEDNPKHFFVKEVEVGFQTDDLPTEIYFVDTPGLSDPVRFRSMITEKYIRNSDWVIACISSEKLSESGEIKFLQKILTNKGNDYDKLFVVATKKDMLMPEDLNRKVELFLENLASLFGNKQLAQNRFFSVAAETQYLIHKCVFDDQELTNDEFGRIMKSCVNLGIYPTNMNVMGLRPLYDDLSKFAGISELFDSLSTRVIKQRRNILVKEIKKEYNKTVRIINESLNNEYLNLDELLFELVNRSKDYKENLERIELQKKITEENIAKIEKSKESIQKFIDELEVKKWVSLEE